MTSKQNRAAVLRTIFERKEILFGAFSDKLTKEDKPREWNDIHIYAQSLGLVPVNKDVTYTCYTMWQNIRKNTMKKIDNRNQTGSGGEKDFELNEIDQLVLNIIGKDSPAVVGLLIAETWQEQEVPETPENQEWLPVHTPTFFRKRKASPVSTQNTDLYDLRSEKLKLQIELLKNNYLRDLQIAKLEQELGIENPPNEVM